MGYSLKPGVVTGEDYKTLLKKISKIEDGIHYLNPMGSIA